MPSRHFDSQRAAQGFKSQAHLDAFYAYHDHTSACAECQKPGPPVELSDGLQPTRQVCQRGRELFAAFCEF